MQRHGYSPSTITTGSRRSRNSYMYISDGCCGAGHDNVQWEKHWYLTSQMWKSMLESDYLRVLVVFENCFFIYWLLAMNFNIVHYLI